MNESNSHVAHVLRQFMRFRDDESGATAIEYALIASGVGVAVAATVYALGSGVKNLFTKVNNVFP
jgi:pilus assembly protein Flp/PilA